MDGSYITTCPKGKRATEGPFAFACANSTGSGLAVAQPCNPAAAEQGGYYAALMFLASLGYMAADVAADGLTVMYAKREPLAKRGYAQTTAYLVRSIGQICAVVLVAFGMNGKEYNGSFSWGLSFPAICGIVYPLRTRQGLEFS